MEQVILKNAPIKEAIIDIRVRSIPDAVPKIKELHAGIAAEYPSVKSINQGQIVFEMKRGAANLKSSEGPFEIGSRFTSEDGKNVVQMRTDGLTFSRLKPYSEWKTMREEARKLWELYCSKLQPKSVLRLAVRFINIIEVPQDAYSAANYLSYPPKFPGDSEMVEEGFLTRIILNRPSLGARVAIAQARENVSAPLKVGLLLDIDVSKKVVLPVDDSEVWSYLDKFRLVKNEIFFSSITSATKELIA